jgi:hypothetical protein
MAQNIFSPVALEFQYNGQFFTIPAGQVALSLPDDVAAFAMLKFGRDKGVSVNVPSQASEGY